ncbi:MAG: MgtC/SapB family protein, partial [Acidimicrobiia bacterium]
GSTLADLTGADLANDVSMARLGVAVAVGLLIGLQRQFAKQHDPDDMFAGARTFALIALMGGASSLLTIRFDSILPIVFGFGAVAAIVGIGYLGGVRSGSMGLTTEMAALVTFAGGALAGDGQYTVSVALAVATTALLAAKPYTYAFVERLDREDVEATVQFAVLVALVLPVLPREPIGPSPFDAASPFKIGLMVVFILGLSFLGYVLIKVVGARRGIGLTGILGGLVSSTAVTLTMSERSKHSSGLRRPLAMALLLAWAIMYGRVVVEVAVVNADLLRDVALPIGVGGAVTALWAGWVMFRHDDADGSDEDAQRFTNPFRVGPAIQFGLLYGVVLIGSKALSEWLGDAGVYIGAITSGLADVDAITLSMAELSRGDGSVGDQTAANAIVLAAASNAIVKGGLVWVLGSRTLGRLVTPAVAGAVVTSVALTFAV